MGRAHHWGPSWKISGYIRLTQKLASGKHTKNYGKSPFLMAKSVNQLFLWSCSIAMFVYQRVTIGWSVIAEPLCEATRYGNDVE